MFMTGYQFDDGERGTGTIMLQGGQWVGDECVFEFSVPTRGVTGVVRSNWRQPSPIFELTDGTLDDPETCTVIDKVRELLPGFHRGGFADVTAEDLEAHYNAHYHTDQSYAVDSEFERERKGVQADLTIQLTLARKVLVAGCSAGECLRQLRARRVEAWGFDICPEIETIAYPDVQPYVRRGSVTDIPFGPEDGFDTLTAFDVLEHIPEQSVPKVVEEFVRLDVHWVVVLIAHCEYNYTGHVTLRPLPWWDEQMAPAFRRRPNHELPNPWPSIEPANPDPTKLLRVYERQR